MVCGASCSTSTAGGQPDQAPGSSLEGTTTQDLVHPWVHLDLEQLVCRALRPDSSHAVRKILRGMRGKAFSILDDFLHGGDRAAELSEDTVATWKSSSSGEDDIQEACGQSPAVSTRPMRHRGGGRRQLLHDSFRGQHCILSTRCCKPCRSRAENPYTGSETCSSRREVALRTVDRQPVFAQTGRESRSHRRSGKAGGSCQGASTRELGSSCQA